MTCIKGRESRSKCSSVNTQNVPHNQSFKHVPFNRTYKALKIIPSTSLGALRYGRVGNRFPDFMCETEYRRAPIKATLAQRNYAI
ncbi:hypothetical protein CEXT_128471 [Caerostris extrusa]|uniref:Uncharacterized protein n=1 Tax=Caerostris extrusa TaxID=172846 RepID=A0AAV4SC01_CAEEX|nr:hypothetical protein CEXT_128471 [Caerostris extrusa]